MTDHNKKDDTPDKKNEKTIEIDKSKFGTITPLTAVQIVSLLIKTDTVLGACIGPCGPCGGGPNCACGACMPCGACY